MNTALPGLLLQDALGPALSSQQEQQANAPTAAQRQGAWPSLPAQPEAEGMAVPGAAGVRSRLDAIYVLNSLAIGGSERKTVRIVNGLIENGLSVGVISLNRPDALLPMLDQRAQVWFLERSGKFSPAALHRLRRIVVAARPRMLFGVNLYPSLYVSLAAALSPHPRPSTVCLVNTCAAGGMPAWRRLIYRSVMSCTDRSVHGCEAYRSQWLSLHGRDAQRSAVIYNGIDLDEFQPVAASAPCAQQRALYGIAADRFVIGTVGRLAPEKNQMVLVESLARLRWAGLNAHLLIVGDGPARAALAERAAKLNVASRVAFAGALSDVRPALAAMDVFVLPSVEVETFSNAALEAMAMQRPVILCNIGGAAEMLNHGVEGFIVPPHELAARLPALLNQLYADNKRRALMGAAARARVEARFSLANMVERHLNLIRSDPR